MPLVKRTVEPVHICRGEAVGVVRDELKYFNVTSLANVIRQLGSLSAHVDDIFNELCRDAISITRRTMALSERAERLKIKITQLNPTVEEVLLQDINTRKPFKSSIIKDQQVISLATRPFAIIEAYQLCEPPPPLQKLNPYRQDGKDSLKFYTEPGYFFELWCQAMQKDAARNQIRRNKRQRRSPYSPQAIQEDEKVTKDVQKSRSKGENQNRAIAKDAGVLQPVSSTDKYGYSRDGAIQLRSATVGNGRSQSRPNSLELQNGVVMPVSTLNNEETSAIMLMNPPAPPVRTAGAAVKLHSRPTDRSVVSSMPYLEPDLARSDVRAGSAADGNSAEDGRTSHVNIHAVVKNSFSESVPKSPAFSSNKQAQENSRGHFTISVLPSPPPTPPTVQRHRVEAMRSPLSSTKSPSTKSNTPESVIDLPPPPTPPPQFCQSGSLDSPGTVLPPPPLDEDGCFEIIPSSVSPPPPMSPSTEDLSVLDGSVRAFSTELELGAAQSTGDGVSITSESGSMARTDASTDQPLVRDTRSDLLAAIREGIQLRKVEERRLKTQKHRPAGHLDVQSLMEVAFEMRRKALEENDSDEDDADEADELNGNWSDVLPPLPQFGRLRFVPSV